MKSVMTHQFSQVPRADIQRSSFDRSHGLKTTFDANGLVPIYVDEALPGDTFNLNMTGFARMATPIYPLMDNLYLETFFFAVPLRLLWSNWEKFNGAQDNPADTTDFEIPQMVSTAVTGYSENSLHDYLGLPTKVPDVTHSSLWHRAYNLIWNEWFRDQNMQDSIVVDLDDGPDNPSDYILKRRNKKHDYFTSALPWPQKGTGIPMPLGSVAPVISAGTGIPLFDVGPATHSLRGNGTTAVQFSGVGNAGSNAVWDTTSLEADLSSATAATINQLRQAFQIQKLLERDARGGTRYVEIIKAHFNVVSPDFRLQRPEYLGGGSSPVNITPIAQTSSTDATSPQGNLAATGTSVLRNHGFTKSFTEHCILIGLANIRSDLTYQQGLPRQFSRLTRYDFYWPALANIGEQTILNKEIYCDGSVNDNDVFGYQERYAEYRYKPSQITGRFRSNCTTPLDAWHLSQDFAFLPTLSGTFIRQDTPMSRVVAVTTEPHFIFDSYFNLRCARPMPLFGVPGLIDHF